MKRASLNHTYRLVWNALSQTFVAVAENVKSHGKGNRSGRSAVALAVSATIGMLAGTANTAHAAPPTANAPAANALPTGGQITAGTGAIASSGNTLTVNQTSDKLIANWNTFNIGRDATVQFNQPGSTSQALNRITDQSASQIFGQLKANGQVYLLNPNGIVFGAGSQVNVGGLVASTLQLSDADFMAGQLRFTNGNGAGGISNQGSLSGKLVALIAPQVSNQGSISATGGNAALVAGDEVSLDFTGDGLLKVQVDRGTYNALVENKALIEADGGQVVMTAKTADTLLATVVNNTGTIRARTLANQAGRIVLIGDMDNGVGEFGGTLDASAPNGGDGGFIETSAHKVQLKDDLKVSTDAATGKTGEWLIDPTDFTIAASGGDITGAALVTLLQSNNVTIQTGTGTNSATNRYGASGSNGDIFVKDSIITTGSLGSDRTLTFKAQRNITFDLLKFASPGIYATTQGSIDATAGGNTKKLNLVIWSNFSGTGGAVRFATPSVQMGANNVNIKTNGGSIIIFGGANADPAFPRTGNNYATGINSDPEYSSGIYLTNVNITTNGGDVTMRGKSATASNSGNDASTAQPHNTVAGILSSNRQVLNINAGQGSIYLEGVAQNVSTTPGLNSHGISLNGGTITSSKTGNLFDWYITLKGSANLANVMGAAASVSLEGYSTSDEQIISQTGGAEIYVDAVAANGVSQDTVYAKTGLRMGYGTLKSMIQTLNGGTVRIQANAKDGNRAVDMSGNSVISTLAVSGNYADTNVTVPVLPNHYPKILFTSLASGDIYSEGRLITQGETIITDNGTSRRNLSLLGDSANNLTSDSNFYIASNSNDIRGPITILGTFAAIDIRNAPYDSTKPYNMGVSSLGGSYDASGVVRVGAYGDLKLTSAISTTSTTRDAIVLSAYGNFINSVGASALTTGSGGRWMVYSEDPRLNSFGPTAGNATTYLKSSNQAVWRKYADEHTTLANTYTGNRYIFGLAGKLEFTGTGGPYNIEYGNSAGATPTSLTLKNNSNSTVAGGSVSEHTQYGSVFSAAYTGSPDFSGGTGSLLNVGSYSAPLSVGSTVLSPDVTATYNGTATVTVTPKQLTASLASKTKPYDGTSTATLTSADYTLNGLVAGQSFTIGKTSGDYYKLVPTPATTSNVSEATHVAVTGLVSSDFTAGANTLASNYIFPSQATGTGTITPLTLTASIIGSPTKVYDRSTSITTLNPSSYQLTGLATPGAITINKTTGDFNSKDVATANLITTTLQSSDFTVASGTLLSNYTFPTTASGAGSITKANLTVTGITTNNKEYDGTTATTVSATGASFTGLISGDSVTLGTTANFADKNAGTGKNIIVSLGGADAGNYQGTATATADITRKALTVSGITATPKVYDGGLTAPINIAGAIYTGLVGSDAIGLAATGTFADKNVANGKTITLNSTYTGADAGNYTITSQPTTTGNITPKAISISGITATPKVYDGLTAATVNTSSAVYSGLVSGDVVTVSATGSFANKNVGTSKTVTLASSYTGADKSNYTITDQASTTTDITAKALTISGITAANKVYNKSTTATVNTSSAVYGGLVSGDAVTVSATGSFADANAGTAKTVTLSSTNGGADLANYTVTNQATTTADITQKPLTITGVTVNDKVYDGTKTATVNTTSAQYGGIETGDTVNVSFAGGGEFVSKDAGTNKPVTLLGIISGASAANYSLSGSLTANISAKALTVSGITASNKDYDGSVSATVSTSGAVFGGIVSGDVVNVSSTGTFADKNAGTGKTVTLASTYTGADAGNYSITDQATTTASINKKALTITGSTAADRVYDGGVSATITPGTLSGLVGGETLTATATGTFDSKNAGTRTATAVYTLANSGPGGAGGLASNYSLANTTHSATINRKALSISGITAAGKVYDGTTTAAVSTSGTVYGGLVSGDVVNVAATGTFADKNAATGKTVSLSSSYSGGDKDNYSITDQASTTADISAKALTASIVGTPTKTYDGTLTATLGSSNFSLSGLVGGETLTVTKTSGSYNSKDVASASTVSTTLASTDFAEGAGTLASNYTLPTVTATSGTGSISKKALTVTGVTASHKVYDGNTTATVNTGSAVYNGLVTGDTVSVSATGVFDTKNVGTDKAVALVSSYSGADKDNYTITSQAATRANVTPKTLTLSGVKAANKMFDGNATATIQTANAVFEGLLSGETIQIAALGEFADSNPGQEKLVSYQLSGADLANYTAVLQPVTADITPQPSGAVSALTAPQIGITGTADTLQVATSSISNTVKPGTGSETLVQVPTRVLIVAPPVTVPPQVSLSVPYTIKPAPAPQVPVAEPITPPVVKMPPAPPAPPAVTETLAPVTPKTVVPIPVAAPVKEVLAPEVPPAAPVVAAPVTQVPTTPPPDTAPKSSFTANLLFDYDKAELTVQEKQKLDQLIPQIKQANPEKLLLVGHTDSNGADSYNEKLSLRRVETVKSYLVTKGVDKNRIQIEAKSETQPVRDNDTANNRAANRRVELVWQ